MDEQKKEADRTYRKPELTKADQVIEVTEGTLVPTPSGPVG